MIETARLILREMNENDFDALYAVLADSDIMRHYPYNFDNARVAKWIRTNAERYQVFGFGLWAVTLKDSGETIGDCGLTMQNINGFIRPEIGYPIRADRQRNGYAREAAIAVKNWAFENTPFKVLYSYMKAENMPSRKTTEAIGMQFVESYTDNEGEKTSVYCNRKIIRRMFSQQRSAFRLKISGGRFFDLKPQKKILSMYDFFSIQE